MKKLFQGLVSVAVFTVGLGSTAVASTALELVVNGVDTIFVPDNGAIICTGPDCGGAFLGLGIDVNLAIGAISIPGITIDGWSITVTTGGSNSPSCPPAGPNGPGCLNTESISSSTTKGGSLSAFFESTGFTPEPGFAVAFSSAFQTGDLAAQKAFIGGGGITLGPGVLAPAPVGPQCGATLSSAPPGVVALDTSCGPGGGTLELTTAFTTAGPGGFNVNGNIAAVPEPAAVALFGTVLAVCASGLRRRRKLS